MARAGAGAGAGARAGDDTLWELQHDARTHQPSASSSRAGANLEARGRKSGSWHRGVLRRWPDVDRRPPEYFDSKSLAPEVVSDGNYFVLGDHRNSSNDSRTWGLVPKQNIFGEAVFRYWPLSQLGLIR